VRTWPFAVLALLAISAAVLAWRQVSAATSVGVGRTPAALTHPATPPVPHPHASTSTSQPEASPSPTGIVHTPSDSQLSAAAAYAKGLGYAAGLCVIDMKTGAIYTGGVDELYATESVAKVFIATRLLVAGEMTGATADTAYKMITQSDDASANALWAQTGGDDVIEWVEQHYNLPRLGMPPTRYGWWGLNHVHSSQLAQLLVKLRHDPAVWPWLGNAMAHATHYGSDGYDQSFGLRQVDPHAVIKQGWGHDFALPGSPADLNTTGFVDGGRYAVVIMVRGPSSSYFAPIASIVTQVTRLALLGQA